MSMIVFFQAFDAKDFDRLREDHSLIDGWVESESRCTASIDVETAWDVLKHILGDAGFHSDDAASDVLSNGCDFASPALVREQAKALSSWTQASVLEALRAIDEDEGLYHQAVYQDQEDDLLAQFDMLLAFFREAAARGDGVLHYAT